MSVIPDDDESKDKESVEKVKSGRCDTSDKATYKWVEQIKKDGVFRDEKLAARYVATLRPAMASVRFVRVDQYEKNEDGEDDEGIRSQRRVGEGGVGHPNGEGTAATVPKSTVAAGEAMAVSTRVTGASNDEVVSSDETHSCTGEQGYSVERARLERR
ncbi:hypothetical protein GN958_ATG18285 [Phytophthora infestans]|uniref:Uncharacterized protein n=1 Tax=Phytophthora infestans TaxID=4787 RepID=A0A8S9TVQ8_PHYIN|nr:hypothetical protein GN958_ATG18285 [Phytophthora infestans]